MSSVIFMAEGVPAPQGSKRAFRSASTGRVVMLDDNRARLKAWRECVTAAGVRALGGADPFAGPVAVWVTFWLPRPQGHFGTGRNAGSVKGSAPQFPAVVPDLDKLVRAVFDSVTAAKVWRDDSQVVEVRAVKRYATDAEPAGALVVVEGVGA